MGVKGVVRNARNAGRSEIERVEGGLVEGVAPNRLEARGQADRRQGGAGLKGVPRSSRRMSTCPFAGYPHPPRCRRLPSASASMERAADEAPRALR